MLPINPTQIPALFKRARAAQMANQLEEAARLYRAILAAKADLPEVQFNLGQLLAAQGEIAEARAVFEAALKLRAQEPAIWGALATVMKAQGDQKGLSGLIKAAAGKIPRQALDQLAALAGQAPAKPGMSGSKSDDFKRLLDLMGRREFAKAADLARPLAQRYKDDAVFATVLATAEAELGHPHEAEASFREAIARNPDYAEAHAFYGEFLVAQGRAGDAVTALEAAVMRKPDLPNAGFALALAYLAQDRADDAGAVLARMAKAQQRDPRFEEAMGRVRLAQGDDRAIAHLERAIAAGRDTPANALSVASALSQAGRIAQALTLTDTLVGDAQVGDDARRLRITLLQNTGRFDEATAEIRAMLNSHPQDAGLFAAYVTNAKMQADDPMIAKMQALFDTPDLPEKARGQLGFALSKAMEDTRQYDRVFGYLDTANAISAKAYPYSQTTDQRERAAIQKSFTPNLRKTYEGKGYAAAGPIFVTGLPRSGTTLIESIIAAHPQVAAAGEFGKLSKLLTGGIAEMNAGGSTDFAAIGKTYWDMLQFRYPGAARITDKSIGSYNFIGFIRLAMPNARIIVVRRDPRDTCLSIYKNQFRDGTHRYASDLRHIAKTYRAFEDQVAFWRKTWPGAFSEIRYEDVTADPETQSRALIAACNLDWDDACLSPHKSTSTVKTLSVFQARQPIYRSSVAAWKRYEKELAPLIEELDLPKDIG